MEKIDARKLPPEALEHIRRQAFVLRKQGYTWAHIAEVCGVHVGTVLKWARRAQADSLDTAIKGGQRGRRHGSGRTLTLVQEERLRLIIIGSNPAQLQLEFALWNRRAVMLAIKQLFGIDMPIRTVGEYLRRWGFTPQRPVKRALEQDPARLKAWLEDEYPKMVARAKIEDAEIYWGDETAIRQDSNWARGYSMARMTPELRLPAGRHGSTSMISAITNQGLVRFSFFEGAIYALPRAELRRELIAQLRFAHKSRMPRSRGQDRRGQLPNMTSIHLRPIEAAARLIPGHWEGDLIKGAGNRSAVGTLVERKSRYLLMTRLRDCSAEAVLEAFTRKFRHVPPCVRKTLTYDQGKEMARHELLAKRLKIDVYFADPHSPWQRPTNENTNGLIREYLPKGLDLAPISQGYLNAIARQLNDRPRKCLDFETPAEVFAREIMNLQSGVALQT